MCEENRSALEECGSKSDAIALYKKTIDWALEEGYPSLQVLESEFSDCEADGVFVGKHFNGELLDAQQVYVFHHCSGWIRTGLNIQEQNIPMLYFANGCDMKVLGNGVGTPSSPSRVPLYVFGDNKVRTTADDNIEWVTYPFEVK